MIRSILYLAFAAILMSCGAGLSPAEREALAEEAVTSIGGATLVSYDPFHGTQIEFHDPEGFAMLWYPGNTVIVPSYWKIDSTGYEPEICYLYPSSSFNPVTEEFGGDWDCRGLEGSINGNDWYEGDPFNLRSSALPFVLRRDGSSLEEIAIKAGISPDTLIRRNMTFFQR